MTKILALHTCQRLLNKEKGPYKRTLIAALNAYPGGTMLHKQLGQTVEKRSFLSTQPPRLPRRRYDEDLFKLVYPGAGVDEAGVDEAGQTSWKRSSSSTPAPCLPWLRAGSTPTPALAVIGKIQLANAPQYKSFYTVSKERNVVIHKQTVTKKDNGIKRKKTDSKSFRHTKTCALVKCK